MKKCPKNEVAGSFFAVSAAKTSDLCLLEEKTVQKSPVSSILGQKVEDSRQEPPLPVSTCQSTRTFGEGDEKGRPERAMKKADWRWRRKRPTGEGDEKGRLTMAKKRPTGKN
jgi:hypothetical protein